MSSLFVISGNFTGAGKTSIRDAALKRFPGSKKIITCTTRAPRREEGEQDGVHYRFLSKREFTRLIKRGAFAEFKQGFGTGAWYGTLYKDIEQAVMSDAPVFLVIELQGVRTLQERKVDANFVFIDSELREIKERLQKRGDEAQDIERRLQMVKEERKILREVRIDRMILNNDGKLDRAVEEFANFVTERMIIRKSARAFAIRRK